MISTNSMKTSMDQEHWKINSRPNKSSNKLLIALRKKIHKKRIFRNPAKKMLTLSIKVKFWLTLQNRPKSMD